MDLARDFAGFLYLDPMLFQPMIDEIAEGLGVSFGAPVKATNSSSLMLQVLFVDLLKEPLLKLTVYNKSVFKLH